MVCIDEEGLPLYTGVENDIFESAELTEIFTDRGFVLFVCNALLPKLERN